MLLRDQFADQEATGNSSFGWQPGLLRHCLVKRELQLCCFWHWNVGPVLCPNSVGNMGSSTSLAVLACLVWAERLGTWVIDLRHTWVCSSALGAPEPSARYRASSHKAFSNNERRLEVL